MEDIHILSSDYSIISDLRTLTINHRLDLSGNDPEV